MKFVVFLLAFAGDYGLLAGESMADAVEAGSSRVFGSVECLALARLAASLAAVIWFSYSIVVTMSKRFSVSH